jgi:uncharacterized membrane protein YbhN (UPF0104 family)
VAAGLGTVSEVLRKLRPALAVVLLAACVLALWSQWDDVRDQLGDVGPLAFAGSVALGVLGAWLACLGWRVLLADVGGRLGVRDATAVHFAGQLGKYVPGGVWPVVAQASLNHDRGIARSATVAAFVLHMLVSLASAIAVAALTLPLGDPTALADRWWLLVLLPAVLVVLHPAVLTRLAVIAARLLRRPEVPVAPSAGAIATAAAFVVASNLVFGLHLLVIVEQLDPEGPRIALQVTGAFALAWAVGFVVIITPSGLGVREVAMTVALSAVLPTAAATAAALVSRLALTATDLAWGAMSMAMLGTERRRVATGRAPPEPE